MLIVFLPTLLKRPALPVDVKNRSSIAVFDNKGAGYNLESGNLLQLSSHNNTFSISML